jgi:hypothetical protein
MLGLYHETDKRSGQNDSEAMQQKKLYFVGFQALDSNAYGQFNQSNKFRRNMLPSPRRSKDMPSKDTSIKQVAYRDTQQYTPEGKCWTSHNPTDLFGLLRG